MRLKDENQILDEAFRRQVINEIEGPENQARKNEAKKRYDIFKDQTKKYVIQEMQEESEDKSVVAEIKNRAANVSFLRKIIDKKAVLYSPGVRREVPGDELGQGQVDLLVDMTNLNSVMKKANKYSELFKNALVNPTIYEDKSTGFWRYGIKVLAPYSYDVIEDADFPENARIVIFSYFTSNTSPYNYAAPHQAGVRGVGTSSVDFTIGDQINQTIADSPGDEAYPIKHYVWWSNQYHLTTNDKGQIISDRSPEGLLNPIGRLPFVDFSTDKDGHYWALGGSDLVDGSILLNVLLTDLYYIAKYQGMGTGYMFGKGVPKNVKVGPSSFLTLEMKEGDPVPQIGYATSSPPIGDHLALIEQYVSFLLATNNLEPGTVSGQLSAGSAASGIQEMIKRSEITEDLEDQKEIYRDNEPALIKILIKWHNLLLDRGVLDPDFAQIGRVNEYLKINLKFNEAAPFMTELEKLGIIEKRLDLGLDSMIDAIMKDNPELSEEDAVEKARKVLEARLQQSRESLLGFTKTKEETPAVEEEEEKEESPDMMEE